MRNMHWAENKCSKFYHCKDSYITLQSAHFLFGDNVLFLTLAYFSSRPQKSTIKEVKQTKNENKWHRHRFNKNSAQIKNSNLWHKSKQSGLWVNRNDVEKVSVEFAEMVCCRFQLTARFRREFLAWNHHSPWP